MAWYNESSFYHIYPLGLCGCEEYNSYENVEHRLKKVIPWITHIKELGCSGLYIGPLFKSISHGYDTTDYYQVDNRLGDNDDLKELVNICHENGIKVILDGVFNHTGRDFFAFKDIQEYRENSAYLSWYNNVNFFGNNEYNDGFSYDNWGGYNALVKFNLDNPDVRNYLLDVVRFWVKEFDIDGLRLDAADVLNFQFMRELRSLANEIKEDFWLMGEVIHGDYSRWVNENTLNSVTNYHLHKALFSCHNDHNYFELAHTVKRQLDAGLGNNVKLYSFVDNHDVERIINKLNNRNHYLNVHILMYTLPGIPSIYYGSEFGIEGKKERYSDASLRPSLDLNELLSQDNDYYKIIKTLGKMHQKEEALWYGDYQQLHLTTTSFAFSRDDIIVTVNNSSDQCTFDLNRSGIYKGVISGRTIESEGNNLHIEIDGDYGEIWIPTERVDTDYEALKIHKIAEDKKEISIPERASGKSYDEMSVEELQAEILAKMSANGPVTDRMKKDVLENVYHDSLLNWVKSFH